MPANRLLTLVEGIGRSAVGWSAGTVMDSSVAIINLQQSWDAIPELFRR